MISTTPKEGPVTVVPDFGVGTYKPDLIDLPVNHFTF